jgi:murein L,D-transpeptidase YafK
VGLKGREDFKIEGSLPKRINSEDSLWTLEDGRILCISLLKENKMEWWRHILQGEPEIDVTKVQPENSQLSDLDPETRQTVEKMMFDQNQKARGLPTSDEMQKQEVLARFMREHPEMDFTNAKIG